MGRQSNSSKFFLTRNGKFRLHAKRKDIVTESTHRLTEWLNLYLHRLETLNILSDVETWKMAGRRRQKQEQHEARFDKQCTCTSASHLGTFRGRAKHTLKGFAPLTSCRRHGWRKTIKQKPGNKTKSEMPLQKIPEHFLVPRPNFEKPLFLVSLGTYNGPERNLKQCFCKILENKQREL